MEAGGRWRGMERRTRAATGGGRATAYGTLTNEGRKMNEGGGTRSGMDEEGARMNEEKAKMGVRGGADWDRQG